MRFDGLEFTRRKDLGCRDSRSDETYVDGSFIANNYTVFVKIADCRVRKRGNGRRYYDAINAPMAFPLTGHSLTNMAYGVSYQYEGEVYVPVYLAYKGKVYRARIKQ